jgi:hypothetical protein
MKLDLPVFKKEKTKLQHIEELEKELARQKAEEVAKVNIPATPATPLKPAPVPLQNQPHAKESIYSNIPKKTAALEVIKQLNYITYMGIGGIVGTFAVLFAGTFNVFASYGIAMLVIIPAAVFVQKSKAEVARLKKEYGV